MQTFGVQQLIDESMKLFLSQGSNQINLTEAESNQTATLKNLFPNDVNQ